jgi:hypothetical protein
MYDGGKIVSGLIIFVGLLTFPIWSNVMTNSDFPKVEKPAGQTKCVKPAKEMRTSHMVLLNEWRDEVLRSGMREYIQIDGQPVVVNGEKLVKSIQLGCMKCHTNKEKFCDECHTYTAVKPYCWDCHIQPKEM